MQIIAQLIESIHRIFLKTRIYVKHYEIKRDKFKDRCMTENYFSFNIIYIQDLVF